MEGKLSVIILQIHITAKQCAYFKIYCRRIHGTSKTSASPTDKGETHGETEHRPVSGPRSVYLSHCKTWRKDGSSFSFSSSLCPKWQLELNIFDLASMMTFFGCWSHVVYAV